MDIVIKFVLYNIKRQQILWGKKCDKDKINQKSRVFRGSSFNMVVMAGCIKKEIIKQRLRGKGVNQRIKGENKFQGESTVTLGTESPMKSKG